MYVHTLELISEYQSSNVIFFKNLTALQIWYEWAK
jgi:hypothetical protein